MSWASDLQRAFADLTAGRSPAPVAAGDDELRQSINREIERLATAVVGGPAVFSREQRHDLRNSLAGILAALHMLKVTEADALGSVERAALDSALAQAREFGRRFETP